MNHTYTRAGGIWSSLSGLSASELADLDAKTVDSISATGGVYSLVDPLIFGGASLTYVDFQVPVSITGTGLAIYDGALAVYANAYFGGTGHTFTVDSFTRFNNEVDFNFDTFFYSEAFFNSNVGIGVSGTSLDVYATAAFHAGMTFGDDSSDFAMFNAQARFNALTQFYGSVNINAPLAITGATTVSAPVSFTANGKVIWRHTLGGDANATYTAATTDLVFVPEGTLTANRNYTIDDTGAQDGMRVRFYNDDSVSGIFVKRPNGTTIYQVGGSVTKVWIDVERIAGSWEAIAVGTLA